MSGELVVAAPLKGPVCGCLERLRRQLAPNGFVPAVEHATGAAILYVRRMRVTAETIPIIAASFCPFCGEHYE